MKRSVGVPMAASAVAPALATVVAANPTKPALTSPLLMRARRLWALTWAMPWTLLGLALALVALACGARLQRRAGIWEAYGGALAAGLARLPGVPCMGAITLGHVILAADATSLNALRAHEQVHVRQYERWGPLFVPAYLLAGAWAWLRGGRAYRDNPFECAAYRAGPFADIVPPAPTPAAGRVAAS